MRKILLFVLITFPCMIALAQSDGPNTAMSRDPEAREKIRAAHAAYITERLALSSSEAEKFWPVYREYTEKRRELRMQLRDFRRKDADDKALLELDLKIKQQELDLEKEYTHKLQKIIPAEKMLKLRDAEIDFRKLVLRQIERRQLERRRRR